MAQHLSQLQPYTIAERYMGLDPELCELRNDGDNASEGALFIRRLRDDLVDAIIETPDFVDVLASGRWSGSARQMGAVLRRRWVLVDHAVGEDRKAAARAWLDLGLYTEDSNDPWQDQLEDTASDAVTNICRAVADGTIIHPA